MRAAAFKPALPTGLAGAARAVSAALVLVMLVACAAALGDPAAFFLSGAMLFALFAIDNDEVRAAERTRTEKLCHAVGRNLRAAGYVLRANGADDCEVAVRLGRPPSKFYAADGERAPPRDFGRRAVPKLVTHASTADPHAMKPGEAMNLPPLVLRKFRDAKLRTLEEATAAELRERREMHREHGREGK